MSTVPAVTVDPQLARQLRRAASKLEDARAERDRLVVQALAEGGTLREVAELVGLTGPGVMKIRDRQSN